MKGTYMNEQSSTIFSAYGLIFFVFHTVKCINYTVRNMKTTHGAGYTIKQSG